MRCVLFSIKPEFVEEIKAGRKKFEFRTKVPVDTSVRRMFIYSSYPVKKLVAECEIEEVLSGSPSEIWNLTKLYAGVTETYFLKHYEARDIVYAIKMTNIKFYDEVKDLSLFNLDRGPQNYQYVKVIE